MTFDFENTGIRNVEVEESDTGVVEAVRITFGPHYFIEIVNQSGKVNLSIGMTHHGISLDASQIDGELERAINEIRLKYPDNKFD